MPTDTQIEAYESIFGHLNGMQRVVLSVIEDYDGAGHGGATCWEIMQRTGLKHQTASARFSELKRLNWIADSGLRRKGSTSRNQIVWSPTRSQS